ncbi:MAG: hypothetical protein NVSMB16_09230 [Acidimicrobiales bacterium]
MSQVSPRTCLVVDDEPSIRELVALNLEAEGLVVRTAKNADEAELIARAIIPDLIILDVMMPGRDGYDVLTSLKASEETRDIPVVLLTAKATDEEIWQGWTSGADYYITKPFNVDELIHYVNLIFDGVPQP